MENVLKSKSLSFAIRIVNLVRFLNSDKSEFVISKQILRSGTSIGAMIAEAEFAESKLDFIHKLAIAQKEANETIYWLILLKETEFLSNNQFEDIHNNAVELLKLLTSSIKTTKSRLDNK
jgi:four helix bundle protein